MFSNNFARWVSDALPGKRAWIPFQARYSSSAAEAPLTPTAPTIDPSDRKIQIQDIKQYKEGEKYKISKIEIASTVLGCNF